MIFFALSNPILKKAITEGSTDFVFFAFSKPNHKNRNYLRKHGLRFLCFLQPHPPKAAIAGGKRYFSYLLFSNCT